jgi:hypothetical protein
MLARCSRPRVLALICMTTVFYDEEARFVQIEWIMSWTRIERGVAQDARRWFRVMLVRA